MKQFYMLVSLWALSLPVVSVAQTPRSPGLNFDFTMMITERVRELAYVQLKPEARSKSRPTAADFDVIPVRVNSQGRSDVYHYEGPAPLHFVLTTGQGAALKVSRLVAQLEESASTQRTLVVLVPNEFGDFGILSMDDGETAFPAGRARLLNLSGGKVSGSLDGELFVLPSEPKVEAPRSIDSRVRLGVTYERHGRPVVVFDQSLDVAENERLLLVFLAPFRPGADVRTRIVRDRFLVTQPIE